MATEDAFLNQLEDSSKAALAGAVPGFEFAGLACGIKKTGAKDLGLLRVTADSES